MIAINSTEAYHQAIASGLVSNLQHRVLGLIVSSQQKLTAAEIAKLLGKEKNIITPRLRELVLMDVLRRGMTRKCSITGHNAAMYEFTGRPARPIVREICRHCGAIQREKVK